MPTYEYECESCGNRFERREPISALALTTCPTCGGQVRRVISGGLPLNTGGGAHRQRKESCSWNETGSTCCGRDTRCATPSCESHR